MSLRDAFPPTTGDLLRDLLASVGTGAYSRAAMELEDLRAIVAGFRAGLSEEHPRVRIDFAYNELMYAIDESIAMLRNPGGDTYWQLRLGVFIHYVACTAADLRNLAAELDPPPVPREHDRPGHRQ